jgi:membrane protein implicated in regulation of membrane protease activity
MVKRFNKKWLVAIIPGAIFLFLLVLIVALFLLKLLWGWTIPDLFPGAVAQGLIVSEISWYTAFKLAIFLAVLAAIAGARGHKDYDEKIDEKFE